MNTQNIMATYYYKFALTSGRQAFSSTDSVPDSGWDLSEFNGDSRGTPRVADWSDLTSFNASQFDVMAEVFGFTANSPLGWMSWEDSNQSGHANKYYRDLTANRAYYSVMSIGSNYSGGWHNTKSISSSPIRKFHVGSWYFTAGLKVLAYFPNYKANGGHSSLIINNSTSVTWSDANNRFQSSDGNTTLSHNGTTWVGNVEGTSSTSTLNSSNVGDHVDPVSSDIDWTNNLSVSLPSSGAQGDPHINPLFGNRYTI